jgi:putative redox protein
VRGFADGRPVGFAKNVRMPMTATARAINGGLRHAVDVNGRHTIITDEPERLGGTDLGPAPHELLPAMLASCVSTMIYLYARNRGWDLQDARVEVVYDPKPTPRQALVRVYLPAGLTEAQIKRLQKVAETCPARRALEAGFAFDEQIVVGAYKASAA